MKAKKLILLTPMLLSLVACNGSNDSIAGTYSFQLGSAESTHAGIHLTLTDDLYTEKELDNAAKKFTLTFDIKGQDDNGDLFSTINTIAELMNADDEGTSETSSETSSVDISGSEVTSSEDTDLSINGYYYMIKAELEDGSKVNYLSMGISILDEYEISPFIVEKIIYATYSDDEVKVVVPVSITDLLYQVYWYGYRIAGIGSLLSPVNLEEETNYTNPLFKEHMIGTIPDKEWVNYIRSYQIDRELKYKKGEITNYEEGEKIYQDYFIFHTLSMGLMKQ